MNWFNKLHERKTPPGLEADILRWLPRITGIGVLSLCALSLVARLTPVRDGIDAAKQIQSIDIFSVAIGITFLTFVFTLWLGALTVHIMKGPGYVADAYPVPHSDEPQTKNQDRTDYPAQ